MIRLDLIGSPRFALKTAKKSSIFVLLSDSNLSIVSYLDMQFGGLSETVTVSLALKSNSQFQLKFTGNRGVFSSTYPSFCVGSRWTTLVRVSPLQSKKNVLPAVLPNRPGPIRTDLNFRGIFAAESPEQKQ